MDLQFGKLEPDRHGLPVAVKYGKYMQIWIRRVEETGHVGWYQNILPLSQQRQNVNLLINRKVSRSVKGPNLPTVLVRNWPVLWRNDSCLGNMTASTKVISILVVWMAPMIVIDEWRIRRQHIYQVSICKQSLPQDGLSGTCPKWQPQITRIFGGTQWFFQPQGSFLDAQSILE